MPGVYRKKNCPVCGIEHRRRGPYCSRSHAAQDRTVSAETKAKLSESGLKRYEDKSSDEYLDTVANIRQAAAVSKGRDTTPIPPRKVSTYLQNGETIDGDYWIPVDDSFWLSGNRLPEFWIKVKPILLAWVLFSAPNLQPYLNSELKSNQLNNHAVGMGTACRD